MSETLLDGYSVSHGDTNAYLVVVHPSSCIYKSAVGESFQVKAVGERYKMRRAVFYCMWFYAKPTGHLVARLYSATGTHGTSAKPYGSPLATSDLVDIAVLTSSRQAINFIFSGSQQYPVLKDHIYCIALEVHDGDFGAFDRILVASSSTPDHDGNGFHFKNGAWYPDE